MAAAFKLDPKFTAEVAVVIQSLQGTLDQFLMCSYFDLSDAHASVLASCDMYLNTTEQHDEHSRSQTNFSC